MSLGRRSSAHQEIAALGAAGQGLFIREEIGAGKEIAARIFHEASPRRDGPLVPVNCATIPKVLAESLLFGAVRGANSGAASDTPGYLQAARGGTPFLDEVAELDLAVPAKLLRVIETREVNQLGSTRQKSVEFGRWRCHLANLREAVPRERSREDLYYRIGRPEVRLPTLRERLEEIPHLINHSVRSTGFSASWALVEDCLLRSWPGNVREICAEIRATAVLAAAEGSTTVQPRHLGDRAGRTLAKSDPVVPQRPLEVKSPSLPGSIFKTPETTKVPVQILSLAGATLGLAHKTAHKLFPAPVLVTPSERIRDEDWAEDALASHLRANAADALFELFTTQDFNQTLVATSLGISRTTLIKPMDDLKLPRANDLEPAAIEQAFRQGGNDLDDAARLLRISPSARKRRVTQRDMKL